MTVIIDDYGQETPLDSSEDRDRKPDAQQPQPEKEKQPSLNKSVLKYLVVSTAILALAAIPVIIKVNK